MKIKICGIKTIEDVEIINEAKPDLVGFVLTPFRQQIDFLTAKKLKAALDKSIKTVGVIINEDEDFLKPFIKEEVIDFVQFHGDSEFKVSIPSIKAIRVKDKESVCNINTSCDFVLFDAFTPDGKGSSGRTFDWRCLELYNRKKPFFLAGGINLENIEEALEFNPFSLDISSASETNGKKDREKILNLIRKVRNYAKR